MKAVSYTFKRTEKKYMLTENQYLRLKEILKQYMIPDDYAVYTICNIYFDTDSDELISKSIEKPFFKEKLRLRSYGAPKADSTVFLEIKRKVNGVVFKRRVSMPYKNMTEYLKTGKHEGFSGQVFNEIDYFIKFYHPKPKVYLAYKREAFKGKTDETLRITFDSDIISREENAFATNSGKCDCLLNDGQRLMEIKANDAMPVWLCKALSELKIFPCSFSKYGTAYKNKITNTKGA